MIVTVQFKKMFKKFSSCAYSEMHSLSTLVRGQKEYHNTLAILWANYRLKVHNAHLKLPTQIYA